MDGTRREHDALQECLNVLNVDEENIKALSQAATCALSLSNLNSARKIHREDRLVFDGLS